MNTAGAEGWRAAPVLSSMKKTSFMRYIRVFEILRGDNALSKKLSKNLIAICRPNQTSFDFPVEVVHVTDEIHRQDLDAYTLPKLEVIRAAHRLLIANPSLSTPPPPEPKPMNESNTPISSFVVGRKKALDTLILNADRRIKTLDIEINRCRSEIKRHRNAIAGASKELQECARILEVIAPAKPALPLPRPAQASTPKPKVKHLEKGQRTIEDAFYVPLLEVLVSMGGAGKLHEVIQQVGFKMAFQFTPEDRQRLPSYSHPIRWENTVCWARNSLKMERLLKSNSPRGVWEITDEGRDWLKNIKES